MIRTLIFMSINLLSGSVAMVTSPFYIHQDAANLKCGKWGGGGGGNSLLDQVNHIFTTNL